MNMHNILRVTTCEDTEQLVVQVLDEEEGWMCCHNNDMNEVYEEDFIMDAHDVSELLRDPTGVTCDWFNPYLKTLQNDGTNYKII